MNAFASLAALLLLPIASGCNAVPAPEAVSDVAVAAPDPANAPWHGGQEAFLAACEDWDDWDKPAPPFQIIGNTFHVGTCGISAILVVSPDGHILIDSGTQGGAKVVLANIRALGFDPADVKYIAMSHEHHDHVGGHAALVRATGATVVSSAAGAEVLRRGQVGPDDPQSGVHDAMEPVAVGLVLQDGETLRLGELELTAHATPGHTPGALSWTWWGCSLPGEPPVCRRVAYVDSLSAVSADDYRFSDHPAYVAQFRQSFGKVAGLPCDILLTPHPSSSAMLSRMRNGALDDQAACAAYARAGERRLEERLAKEGEAS